MISTLSTYCTAAYTCNNNQPWAVNSSLSYGFVAAVITGQGESASCCACYELTFTSGPVNGKKMVVQVTNTGSDLGVRINCALTVCKWVRFFGLIFFSTVQSF